MKAIVTGGAGFIGSHLVDCLIALDVEVIVLDNLVTGYMKNVNPEAEFIHVDISDREKLGALGRVFKDFQRLDRGPVLFQSLAQYGPFVDDFEGRSFANLPHFGLPPSRGLASTKM